MTKALYIGDLTSNLKQIKNILNKIKTIKWEFLDWTKINTKNEDFLKIYIDILIDKINSYKKPTTIIIDSFSFLVFIKAYEKINQKLIKKIILINPITKNFYLKSFTFKNMWLPNNARTLIYKQMYLIDCLDNIRENPEYVNWIHYELHFLNKHEYQINLLFNQLINFKTIKQALNFIDNNNITLIIGEKNPMISKLDYSLLKNYKNKCILVPNSSFYHFWENKDYIIKKIKDEVN